MRLVFVFSSTGVYVFCAIHSSTVSAVSDASKAILPSETLMIGSGPLPARAPPEKKTVTKSQPSELPKVSVQQSAAVSSATAAVTVSQAQPVKAPPPVPTAVPPPPKPVVSSTSLPKLTQPLPLPSRPQQPNIARGVAAAFLEQEDDDVEPASAAGKTATTNVSIASSSTTLGVPQNYMLAKKVEPQRPATGKVPEPVPPPTVTSTIATASQRSALPTMKGDLILPGLSGMSYSDIVLAAQMQKTVSGLPLDRGDSRSLGQDRSKRTSHSNRHSSGKMSYRSKRPKTPTDSRGRKKLEIGRNVM